MFLHVYNYLFFYSSFHNISYFCFVDAMLVLIKPYITFRNFESIIDHFISLSVGNRCLCNLDDLALAFDEYHIGLPGLQEYLYGVDQLPFPHEVFQFPVKRHSKHVYESSVPPVTTSIAGIGENSNYDEEDDEALSPLIPTYLPPLPTKEETEKGCSFTKSILGHCTYVYLVWPVKQVGT